MSDASKIVECVEVKLTLNQDINITNDFKLIIQSKKNMINLHI